MNTEIKKLIKLPNRYGDVNFLEFFYKGRTKEHLLWYKLKVQYENVGIQVSGNIEKRKVKEYYSIDPSGGPMLHIDIFEIENMLLHKIVFQKGEGFRLGFIKKEG